MANILNLLQEKNEYLEKFYGVNTEEIARFADGDFENLEEFYRSRAAILDMIGSVDRRIEEFNLQSPAEESISDKEKKLILEELDFRNSIVHRILAQDLQALSFIENAKSEIIKELAKVRSVRKVMSSYKVGMKNVTIDEEA